MSESVGSDYPIIGVIVLIGVISGAALFLGFIQDKVLSTEVEALPVNTPIEVVQSSTTIVTLSRTTDPVTVPNKWHGSTVVECDSYVVKPYGLLGTNCKLSK